MNPQLCFFLKKPSLGNQSVGGLYLSFGTVGKKFGSFLHLTLISKIFMLSWLNAFVVCSYKSFY